MGPVIGALRMAATMENPMTKKDDNWNTGEETILSFGGKSRPPKQTPPPAQSARASEKDSLEFARRNPSIPVEQEAVPADPPDNADVGVSPNNPVAAPPTPHEATPLPATAENVGITDFDRSRGRAEADGRHRSESLDPPTVLDQAAKAPPDEASALHTIAKAPNLPAQVSSVAWLVITKTPSTRLHQIYRLDRVRMEIGRAMDCQIMLDDDQVSMRHAVVRFESTDASAEFVLRDLASTNGTYVNGSEVFKVVLRDGDRITLGETELVFKKL